MKFTALPVSNGDSFLLQVDNNVILVDGGKDPVQIIQLLEKENIPKNHIHLLVCTHYDADHINGIISILKSKKYTFNEIWLPEIIGSLAYTINNNIYEIVDYLRKNKLPHEVDSADSNDDFEDDNTVKIEEQSVKKNSLEKNDFIDLDDCILIMEHNYYHEREIYTNKYEHNHKFEKMLDNMHSYASLINSSLTTGAYIRWFEFKNRLTHVCSGYNLYSENAEESGISIYNAKVFFNLLYKTTLSPINKQSLVFKFEKDDYPNILYTADSNLNFTSKAFTLKNNSIVTAPHHGSQTNDPAYLKILGKDLTFVRSYSPYVRPLSNVYRQLTYDKFCTKCTIKTTITKVALHLKNNAFKAIPKIPQCSC